MLGTTLPMLLHVHCFTVDSLNDWEIEEEVLTLPSINISSARDPWEEGTLIRGISGRTITLGGSLASLPMLSTLTLFDHPRLRDQSRKCFLVDSEGLNRPGPIQDPQG